MKSPLWCYLFIINVMSSVDLFSHSLHILPLSLSTNACSSSTTFVSYSFLICIIPPFSFSPHRLVLPARPSLIGLQCFPLFSEAASCLQSCGRKYRSDPSSLPSCPQNQNRTFFRHQRPGFWPCRQPGCSLIICSCSPSTARMEDKSELEVIDYTLSCLCFLVVNIPGKSWSESLQCCECQRPSFFRRLSREFNFEFSNGSLPTAYVKR